MGTAPWCLGRSDLLSVQIGTSVIGGGGGSAWGKSAALCQQAVRSALLYCSTAPFGSHGNLNKIQ